MAPSLQFYRIATFNISLPRNLPTRNLHLLYANSFSSSSSSPFSCHFSVHRHLYNSQRRTRRSLNNAFDSENSSPESKGEKHHVFKWFSAIFNENSHKESQGLADDDLQWSFPVWGFFCDLIKVFGDNFELVLKHTLFDGLSIGVQWKFESEKIRVPLGKGFMFYISHSYKGKVMIRIPQTFMEPLLHFLPLRLKIMASVAGLREKIGWFMLWESENKAKRITCIVLSLLAMAALLFFFRLLSFKLVFKLCPRR